MEDPTTKRHQPRNYLETLEERVALLEGLLGQVRPDAANTCVSHGDFRRPETHPSPSSAGTQLVNNEHGGLSSMARANTEPDEVSELASQVGMLGLNAAGAEPQYLGSSSAFAFSRIINLSLRQEVPGRFGATFDLNQDQASMEYPSTLPDYEAGLKLSDAYFQNIQPHYPFLHEATFRTWEARLTRPSQTLDTLGLDSIPLFFLNMVSFSLVPSKI